MKSDTRNLICVPSERRPIPAIDEATWADDAPEGVQNRSDASRFAATAPVTADTIARVASSSEIDKTANFGGKYSSRCGSHSLPSRSSSPASRLIMWWLAGCPLVLRSPRLTISLLTPMHVW